MSSLLELYTNLIKLAHPYEQEFADTFRSAVASDIKEVFLGISTLTKINCLEYTCQHVSQFAKEQNSDVHSKVASQLWGPAQQALFNILKTTEKLDKSSIASGKLAKDVQQLPVKKPIASKTSIAKKSSGLLPKPKPSGQNGDSRPPTVASKKDNTTTRKLVSRTAREESATLFAQLEAIASNSHLKYGDFCTKPNCTFCSDLFRVTDVTPCSKDTVCDHVELPCSKDENKSWYPHMGKPLRRMLKKLHTTQEHFVQKSSSKGHGLGTLANFTALRAGSSGGPSTKSVSFDASSNWADESEADFISHVSRGKRPLPIEMDEDDQSIDPDYSPKSPKVGVNSNV